MNNVTVSGSIQHQAATGVGTFQATVASGMPVAIPPPPPIHCFLCMRKNQWTVAVTVYMGTYLCAFCAQNIPEKLIINELLP